MDSLNYNYYKGTNQLRNVRDGVSATNYSNDIDDEPSIYNYRYNAIGELAKDSAGNIDTIIWNVYGKVQQITFYPTAGINETILFVYDPLGNRLEKIKITQPVVCHLCPPQPRTCDTTKYVRDAQGNILAVYHRRNDTTHLTEWDIYGSKRIGVVDTNLLVYEPVPVCPLCPIVTNTMDSATTGYLEGQKQYELTNHLGNVLVTVSDKVTPVDTLYSVPHIADYYEAVIINAQDYYPFGMAMPGRSYRLPADSSYRYAFNGKLHDDDIYGQDNSYDYGMRMYNPRLGKFFSVDPLTKKYPMLTPYQFASNTPIWASDLDGKEAWFQNSQVNTDDNGNASLKSGEQANWDSPVGPLSPSTAQSYGYDYYSTESKTVTTNTTQFNQEDKNRVLNAELPNSGTGDCFKMARFYAGQAIQDNRINSIIWGDKQQLPQSLEKMGYAQLFNTYKYNYNKSTGSFPQFDYAKDIMNKNPESAIYFFQVGPGGFWHNLTVMYDNTSQSSTPFTLMDQPNCDSHSPTGRSEPMTMEELNSKLNGATTSAHGWYENNKSWSPTAPITTPVYQLLKPMTITVPILFPVQ